MYRELNVFLRHILCQKAIWKDGELWTSLVLTIGSWIWFFLDPSVPQKIRGHFAEILNVTSIIFGFVLTALTFYIQAATNWKDEEKVKGVADKLVDWHVWTIICLLALIACVLLLWIFGSQLTTPAAIACSYALLVFLSSYSGFQILNDALTIWWAFRNRARLEQPKDEQKPKAKE